MLLFRSEDDLAHWCHQRGVARGATLTIAQTWALAQRWYHNRLDPAFHGRSIAEAEAVFASVGLVGSFWRFVDR
jgi:hypothetical protein